MDFVIIANAWASGIDNPTSKHQIALQLARQGHRVLWMEGAGMRRPSLGSGADRGRIARKVLAAMRPPRRVVGDQCSVISVRSAETEDGREETADRRRQTADGREQAGDQGSGARDLGPPGDASDSRFTIHNSHAVGSIHVLSPLLIPLPRHRWVRRFNGALYRSLARFWCWRLKFQVPILINYVPVLCEAMRRGSAKCKVQGAMFRVQSSELRVQSSKFKVHRAGGAEQRSVSSDEVKKSETSGNCAPSTLNSCTLNLSHVVYHCVDRWDKFDMYDSATMAECDRLCCEYADVVIASSRDLFEHCRTMNSNTHLVLHGVDWEHFGAPLRAKGVEQRAEGNVQRSKFKVPSNLFFPLPPESPNPRIPESSPSSLPHFHTRTLPHSITYSPRPSDLPSGPIVGFFGLLSEWVDQDLLVKLARELRGQGTGRQEGGEQMAEEPNPPTLHDSNPPPSLTLNSCTLNSCTLNSCTPSPPTPTLPHSHTPIFPSIVLIGKADVAIARLEGEPNIHILGPRPYASLPQYVAAFEVGIIPFVVNELTSAVNPIKLREMLAAGCPVVSTALPEVEKMRIAVLEYWRNGEMGREASLLPPNPPILQHSATPPPPIAVAHTADDFVAAVKQRLECPPSLDLRRAISETMAAETWEAKVGEILRACQS